MDQAQLKTLLQRNHDGIATQEEKDLLLEWYRTLSKTDGAFFRNESEEQWEMQELWEQIQGRLVMPAQKNSSSGTGYPLPGYRMKAIVYRMKTMRKMAAAAVIVFLVAGGWLWRVLDNNATHQPSPGELPEMAQMHQPVKASEDQSVIQHNTTGRNKPIILGDSSVVRLAPGASIKYDPAYPGGKREIYLKGSAFFDVAKNKEKPLIVYAGCLSTTVLGTSFLMCETKEGCQVKLFTGKVVVNAVTEIGKGWRNPVTLSPGEELRLDTVRQTVAVKKFRVREEITGGNTTPNKDRNQEMVFDHTPLAKVFQTLIAHYHQSIQYDTAAIADIHFSGAILKDDSMSVILQVIGQMNQLTITPVENGFMIRKNP